MLKISILAGLIAVIALVGMRGISTSQAAVPGTNVLYTTDADFDQGTLVNVNHDAPNNNQLQLNTAGGAFPFIWVALSQRCTIAKINTATGVILGEYRTVAEAAGCNQSSRTTVGLDGSVWMGHRGPGGVTHVGLVELNQCVDRNGNFVIDTSTGYGDVKSWPGATSVLSAAEDECIIHHVDTNAAGLYDSRHMSIDAGNNLWVGDYLGGHWFIRINGNSGAVETVARQFACGGYGGLIDSAGVLWSANGAVFGLLRWDPNAPDSPTNPTCVPLTNYGLAVDSAGWIWVTTLGSQIYKVSPDGLTILGPFGHGSGNAQGLAVDANDEVWVSSSLFCGGGCTVGHLLNDGTFVGNVPNPTGAGSTGVAVDADGKIWTVNLNSNTATRIDPTLGPLGCGGTGCTGGTTTVGAVDLTVDFPGGPGSLPIPYPYNYSDMTGSALLNTAPQGTWTVVQDGGAAGTPWGTITWNTEPEGSENAGSTITVEARASDSEAGLGSETYVPVTNGVPINLPGQFIQVRATLKPGTDDVSPVLSDLRIQVEGEDCPTCDQTTITVDEDVTVDLNPALPTCNDGLTNDLCDYFTFNKTGSDASQWKAIFNVGASRVIIKDNATVTTVAVPYNGNNRRAPGIEIIGSCEIFIEGDLDNNGEPGGIVVTSYNQRAGDILVKFDGNINIDGRVINQVIGTLGFPGKITIASCCGDITTGPKSRIETIGVDPGGSDINILTCCERGYDGTGGDILIQGMVHAVHKQGITPTINIVSFVGGITIVGTNDFGEETVAGTKIRRTSGVLVETTGITATGDINIQAHDAVNVIGNTILNKNRVQYGAVAIKSKGTNGQGGDGDMNVISTNGGIRAIDRAFDFENRFNALNAITLQSLNDITLAVSASVNNGAADNSKAVVSSQGGANGKGGTNTLQSYCGAINILLKAQVLANAPGGTPGTNLLIASTGVNNAGTVNPADANGADDVGPCNEFGPRPIYRSCEQLGVFFDHIIEDER